MKILYVCPYAHYSGHHPHAATVEPETLTQSGKDVALLTFCGITNNPTLSVLHETAAKDSRLLQCLRKHTLSRWFLMLAETLLTLRKAVRLYKKGKYDIIHLRDGEPFIFAAPLLSLFHRNLNWCISLTGSVLVVPKSKDFSFLGFYTLVMAAVINNPLWKLVYKQSLRHNHFMFTPQNELTKKGYEEYMEGVFKGRLTCVPWGIGKNGVGFVSKEEARERLGLSHDEFVLLSFGATHPGKDMRTIMKSLQSLKQTMLVHAGTWSFSLGGNPVSLAEEYGVADRLKVFNYYIPETEKPYFFLAADAAVLSYTTLFRSTSSMLWEAAKFGLPVISSDANTLGEDVRKYNLGLLFETENPRSLVDAVRRFKETDIEVFKQNCITFLKDFSETKWAERYAKVYDELLKETK